MNSADAGQQGVATILFAAIALPIVFLIFSFSLDIETYLRAVAERQKVADQAVLYAYRFLPSKSEVEKSLQLFLSSAGIEGGVIIKVTPDTVATTLSGSVPLTFARYFGVTAGLPVNVHAIAQGGPKDAVVFLDTASYLAPDVVHGTAWGEESRWGSALYFDQVRRVDQDGVVYKPQLLTQQCFNPTFSALKHGAASLYEALAGFHLNAVGVGVFPVLYSGSDTIRPVQSLRVLSEGEAKFTEYSNAAVSNADCAAAAEQESYFSHYNFPSRMNSVDGIWNVPDDGLKPISRLSLGNQQFNADYQRYLTVREALWAQTVRPASLQNTAQLLQAMRTMLLSAPHMTERKGLAGKIVKIGVLIAGDVPRVGALRFQSADGPVAAALQQEFRIFSETMEKSARKFSPTTPGEVASLYYIIMRDPSLPLNEHELTKLSEFFAEESRANLSLKLISGSDINKIADAVVSSIIAEGNTALLAE